MATDVMLQETQALALLENPPTVVLAEAQRAAKALQGIIAAKPRKVVMNGEQYLEFEDWQTVARFYGITSREDGDPEFVNLVGAAGFKASAVAIDRTGRVIGRATAYCLNDEEKWRGRTKYEFLYATRSGKNSKEDPGKDEIVWEDNPNKPGGKRPKKVRAAVGEEQVPLFQLASMAQTRAGAKALRSVLSWVVVLAGYRSTPAEELDSQTSVVDAEVSSLDPARPSFPAGESPAWEDPKALAGECLRLTGGDKEKAAELLNKIANVRTAAGLKGPDVRTAWGRLADLFAE